MEGINPPQTEIDVHHDQTQAADNIESLISDAFIIGKKKSRLFHFKLFSDLKLIDLN